MNNAGNRSLETTSTTDGFLSLRSSSRSSSCASADKLSVIDLLLELFSFILK